MGTRILTSLLEDLEQVPLEFHLQMQARKRIAS